MIFLKKITFCTVGSTPALAHARNRLAAWGYEVTEEITPAVTHVLLPVPSLDVNGAIQGGQTLEVLVASLPRGTVLMGGNLPPLECPVIDFLQDEFYLAENAAITAHCALSLTLRHLRKTMADLPVLIIGWGRIGKCLAQLLRSIGAEVTVAVRQTKDAAMLQALGFQSVAPEELQPDKYHIIYNTAPAPVLDQEDAHPEALLIDLASRRGIGSDRVLWARGLPNQMMPEASGMLMAKTALRFALRKE